VSSSAFPKPFGATRTGRTGAARAAEEVAIALHELTGTPFFADQQPVTNKHFWTESLAKKEPR
jgi:hypothetical protein